MIPFFVKLCDSKGEINIFMQITPVSFDSLFVIVLLFFIISYDIFRFHAEPHTSLFSFSEIKNNTKETT